VRAPRGFLTSGPGPDGVENVRLVRLRAARGKVARAEPAVAERQPALRPTPGERSTLRLLYNQMARGTAVRKWVWSCRPDRSVTGPG